MTDGEAIFLATFLLALGAASIAAAAVLRDDRKSAKEPKSPVPGIRAGQIKDAAWVRRRDLYAAIAATVLVGLTFFPLKALWDEAERVKPVSYPKCALVLMCVLWLGNAVRLWTRWWKARV